MVGITQYITKAHIARATLEAIAFQAKEVSERGRGERRKGGREGGGREGGGRGEGGRREEGGREERERGREEGGRGEGWGDTWFCEIKNKKEQKTKSNVMCRYWMRCTTMRRRLSAPSRSMVASPTANSCSRFRYLPPSFTCLPISLSLLSLSLSLSLSPYHPLSLPLTNFSL